MIAAVLTMSATPAFAHDELLGTTPAQDAVVETAPTELELTFSGVLIDEPGATEIVVLGPSCEDLTSADPELDGTRVRQAIEAAPDGAITVQWRVVSSDGHPISGEYAFTVGETGADDTCGPAEAADDADAAPDGMVLAIAALALGAVGAATVTIALRRARRRD